MTVESIKDESREKVRAAVALLQRRGEKLTVTAVQRLSGVNRKQVGDLLRVYKNGDLPEPGPVDSGAGGWARGRGRTEAAPTAAGAAGGALGGGELGDLIAGATDEETLGALASKVMVELAAARLTHHQAGALKGLITERRQLLAAARSAPKEDPERIYLLSEDGALLVDAFERICGADRRAAVMDFVSEQLEADLAELPAVDPVGGL